ncbi:MAG: response regulator [Gammaproteobacteria bacterium]
MKVLLVEDLPLAAKIARFILGDLNCDVDVATNGAEALQKAQSNAYDLIFMDVGLPDATGFEVTSRIRKAGVQVPIYALTAHTDADHRDQAIAAGMTGFLTKPLEEMAVRQLLLANIPTLPNLEDSA